MMTSHSDPIRCWCWHEGSRTTAPSIRLIRDIIDGGGVCVNGYAWERVQRVEDGHPDALTDAALEAVYVARWQARNAVAPSTEQPRPSALSRIWAILRGRG